MDLTLHVWRQKGPQDKGKLETYPAKNISPDMSFLEMLDEINDGLIREGKDPIAFDHDCREGICGMCSQVINGRPHGKQEKTTVCQLHMRQYNDGDEIFVEPWRAKAFPIQKDLIVDRSSLDVIMQAGGYVSCHTGGVPDANAMLVPKPTADYAMDAENVSVVAPVSLLVLTAQRCCLPVQKLPSWPPCRKVKLKLELGCRQ